MIEEQAQNQRKGNKVFEPCDLSDVIMCFLSHGVAVKQGAHHIYNGWYYMGLCLVKSD